MAGTMNFRPSPAASLPPFTCVRVIERAEYTRRYGAIAGIRPAVFPASLEECWHWRWSGALRILPVGACYGGYAAKRVYVNTLGLYIAPP